MSRRYHNPDELRQAARNMPTESLERQIIDIVTGYHDTAKRAARLAEILEQPVHLYVPQNETAAICRELRRRNQERADERDINRRTRWYETEDTRS